MNDREPRQPEQLGDGKKLFHTLLWLVAAVSYLPLCLRWRRGWNGTPVLVKLVGALIVPPFIWMAGGGSSDPMVFQLVWWLMMLYAAGLHFKAKQDARKGLLTNSRQIGFPAIYRICKGRISLGLAQALEVGQWAVFGVVFTLLQQPGLATLGWMWAATIWVEGAVVGRREETLVRESLDQVSHQQGMAAEIHHRLGRR